MSKIRYLIEIYKKLNTSGIKGDYTYSVTPSLSFTDGVNFDSDKSIEANTDSFTLKLQNSKNSYGNYIFRDEIKVDDRIIIYITTKEDITAGNKNDYRRFDGIIADRTIETSASGKYINLKGSSRLDRFLNFTYPATFEPTGSFTSTASNIIQELITAVNDGNSDYQITWDAGNSTTSEEIQYYRNYRPVVEMIAELSNQSLNTEFNALFYLDTENNFVWKQKSKDNEGLKLKEGVDFKRIKIQEKVWEVMNAMIVDCGVDPSGRSVHCMYYDVSSAGEYGLKWANTVETQSEIASSLITKQQTLAGWTDNTDKNKQDFPDSGSYPLTLSFDDRDGAGLITGTKVIATSDASWIAAIRKEAKWQGVEFIKSVLDLTGHVRPKVDIDLIGGDWELGAGRTGTSVEDNISNSNLPITQGDFVEIISESEGGDFYKGNGATGLKLRCIAVNHEIGIGGWDVTLRFEIDMDDAKEYSASGHV